MEQRKLQKFEFRDDKYYEDRAGWFNFENIITGIGIKLRSGSKQCTDNWMNRSGFEGANVDSSLTAACKAYYLIRDSRLIYIGQIIHISLLMRHNFPPSILALVF